MEVVFVTHNKGKIAAAKRNMAGVNFVPYEYELEEPRSDDITYILHHSSRQDLSCRFR